MTTLLFLGTFILLLIITLLIKSTRKPTNFPPGPKWFPVIGCLLDFKKYIKKHGALYLAIKNLNKEYGAQVIGLKLGNDRVIAVSGYENIKTVFTREEYDGRPDNFFLRLRGMGSRKGITFTDGEHWQEQRSFVMRHLRDVGFGKKTMELYILEELQDLFDIVNENASDMKMETLFSTSILSVLWNLVAGRRIPKDDPELGKLIKLLRKRSSIFEMAGGALTQIPWLRFIAPESTGYNLILKLNCELRSFLMEPIMEHHESYNGEVTDLIYAYIKEMKTREGQKSRFTDQQLLMICLDLFIAGSNTTNSMLGFIFYMLLKRPDIQERIYEEIEAGIPKNRFPELTDRAKLNYTEAFLLEIRRLFPIAAIAGPRRVLNDTVLDNYKIPKGTTVLINIWSVTKDKEYWKDPEVCRPERFITPDGLFKPNERIMNFGLGRRRCPGDALAKSVIFLFTVGILQKYKVTTVPGKTLPNPKIYPGLTMTPPTFNIRFVAR